jgi:hypothetical protein
MNVRIYFLCVFLLMLVLACDKDLSTSATQNMKLVEGTWVGKIGSDSLFLTFIEGEFPTVSEIVSVFPSPLN